MLPGRRVDHEDMPYPRRRGTAAAALSCVDRQREEDLWRADSKKLN